MITSLFFSAPGLLSLIALALGYLFYQYLKLYLDQKSGKVPPGPWGLPLVGFIPFMRPDLHLQLVELKKKYGPVIQTKIGQELVLFLTDGDSIREAMKIPAFNGRFLSLTIKLMVDAGEKSLIFNSGKPWKTTRREAIRALSLFSTSKNSSLEAVSTKIASRLIEKLRELEGQSVHPRHILMQSTAAMLSQLSFGLQVENQDNSDLAKIFELWDQFLESFGNYQFLEFMPSLAIFYRKELRSTKEGMGRFVDFISEKLQEHKFDGAVRTIADALKKAAKEADPDELKAVGLTPNDIIMTAVDLFDGGFFTTAENSHWIQLLLAVHPKMQARVHQELDRVVGRRHRPGILDQDEMPFMNACILEALRFTTSAPLALFHATMTDVEFRGYKIPAGMVVLPNLWAANHDPAIFPEPFKFLPERFLTEDGAGIDTDAMFKTMTFGAGGRRCVGENFAKQTLFIMNSSILHEFEISLDPESTGDPLVPKIQFTLAPGDHKLIYKKRF